MHLILLLIINLTQKPLKECAAQIINTETGLNAISYRFINTHESSPSPVSLDLKMLK